MALMDSLIVIVHLIFIYPIIFPLVAVLVYTVLMKGSAVDPVCHQPAYLYSFHSHSAAWSQ